MKCTLCSFKELFPLEEDWKFYGETGFEKHGEGKHKNCKHKWEKSGNGYEGCRKCGKNVGCL